MLGEGQSLRDKVRQEQGTPFGDLLTSIVKSKVIAVDNKDPNSYFRAELRKQIVCLITQNVIQPYIDVTFQEVREDGKMHITATFSQNGAAFNINLLCFLYRLCSTSSRGRLSP